MRYQASNNPLFSFTLPPLPLFPIPILPQINDKKIYNTVTSYSSLQGLNRRGIMALTPPEEGWEVAVDYERLEHVGDGLLESIASGLIQDLYPWLRQGGAAIIRDYLVSNATLAQISVFYHLPSLLRADSSSIEEVKKSEKVQASLLEAWIAGVFYDYLQPGGSGDEDKYSGAVAEGAVVVEECSPESDEDDADADEDNAEDDEEDGDEDEVIPTVVDFGGEGGTAIAVDQDALQLRDSKPNLLSLSMAPLVPLQKSPPPTPSPAYPYNSTRKSAGSKASANHEPTSSLFSFDDLEKMVSSMITKAKTTTITSTTTTTTTTSSTTSISITQGTRDIMVMAKERNTGVNDREKSVVGRGRSPTLADLALLRSASTTPLLGDADQKIGPDVADSESLLNPSTKAYRPSLMISGGFMCDAVDECRPPSSEPAYKYTISDSQNNEDTSRLHTERSDAPAPAPVARYKRTKGEAYGYLLQWLIPLLTPYCQWIHALLSAEQARLDAAIPPVIPRLATPARWAKEDEEARKQGCTLRSLAQHPLVRFGDKVGYVKMPELGQRWRVVARVTDRQGKEWTGEAVRATWKAARIIAAWKVLLQLNAHQQEMESKRVFDGEKESK
ncbi:hypothetical protein IAT40_003739 [Kwoniella sp. CBS 6097]